MFYAKTVSFACQADDTYHAAMVFDAAAHLSPQVMPLDKAVGSHSKRSGTGFGVTRNCSTPPSPEPVSDVSPVPCPKEQDQCDIGLEAEDASLAIFLKG